MVATANAALAINEMLCAALGDFKDPKQSLVLWDLDTSPGIEETRLLGAVRISPEGSCEPIPEEGSLLSWTYCEPDVVGTCSVIQAGDHEWGLQVVIDRDAYLEGLSNVVPVACVITVCLDSHQPSCSHTATWCTYACTPQIGTHTS